MEEMNIPESTSFQVFKFQSAERSRRYQAWFLALTYSLFNCGQCLIVTSSLLSADIGPEACPGVADKHEASNMYESFEQFTSSPADQRTERVQYALVSISFSPDY